MASQQITQVINDTINHYDKELRDISLKIHDNPEQGNKEYKAFHLLTDYLEDKGFKITRGVVGLDTAFIAEYTNGKQGRRVGFCSEYDALPGVGHACGHNLIAISGVACALAIKKLLQDGLISGSVFLFGTPAEESTSGKCDFVNSGTVERLVDFSMMLHPGPDNGLYVQCLALNSFSVEFFGRQAHAGATPWEGVNAVDALMQGFDNVAMLRQQTLTSNRVHGIITEGGKSPNVIPGYASAYFYTRSVTRNQLTELKGKVENCFKAAALATGCTMKITWAPWGQIDDVFTNEVLAENYKDHMKAEGVVFHSRQEEESVVTGSTDMGNITYVVPGIHAGFDIGTDAANHTTEFAAAAATEEAHKKTIRAARCLAMTAADVFEDEDIYNKAVAYFKKGKSQ
ncbi:hypothetical protein INT46_006027 [Mucor plumbeus]|uniref:Peptidase M20 domain-containing protein 2 n=1 Tax=Mucor plumbeus TaxID=97098 RepID=A0A8H7RKA6_9FUNG|nr:hypothetical protein INT46_006027 [Mucor plumbeus]